MKIAYSLTFPEYCRDLFHWIGHTGPISRWIIYLSVLLPALFVLAPIPYDVFLHDILQMPLSRNLLLDELEIFLPSLLFLFFLAMIILVMWPLMRRSGVDIDHNGVLFLRIKFNFRVPWESIDRLDQDQGSIYIGTKSLRFGRRIFARMFFAAIPKRVFDSGQTAQEFFDQAQAYWQAAVRAPAVGEAGAWPPAPEAHQRPVSQD